MIYVTSDLHGYPLQSFLELLQKANFSSQDHLYVLGDVIDRGPEGVALLRWMATQPNVTFLLGNHEAMMLSSRFIFSEIDNGGLEQLTSYNMNMLSNWIRNGGQITIDALRDLLKEDPEVLIGLLEYLEDAPLYEFLQVNGRKFLLVHAGLGNFSPDRPLEHYLPNELYWERPSLNTRYFDDVTVIFGHTPTVIYGPEYSGKILTTDTWICIDCGASMGKAPCLLRLDDLQPFYQN